VVGLIALAQTYFQGHRTDRRPRRAPRTRSKPRRMPETRSRTSQ
jgi:hypothetical protein